VDLAGCKMESFLRGYITVLYRNGVAAMNRQRYTLLWQDERELGEESNGKKAKSKRLQYKL